MTLPDELGLARRLDAVERALSDTRQLVRSARGDYDRMDSRLDRLEAAMLHQQAMLDGIAQVQAHHTEVLTGHTALLTEHSGLLNEHTGLLTEILRRLPEPPAGA